MAEIIELAAKVIVKEEGFSALPYYDTLNIPTYGYGFVCGKQYDPLPKISITVEGAHKKLLELIIKNQKTFASNPDLFDAYKNCNDNRQAILLSMAHQIGIYGLLKFKKMLNALYKSDFEEAAVQVANSLAATQTPARWKRNAQQLQSGELNKYYGA